MRHRSLKSSPATSASTCNNMRLTPLFTGRAKTPLCSCSRPSHLDLLLRLSVLSLLTRKIYALTFQQHGVTSTNALVDVVRFFGEHIYPDLQSASVHPVIQADAIKFVHTFRSQLSKDQLLAVLPLLVPHLENPSFVIHTYAAMTIERVLFIKRDNKLLLVPPIAPQTGLTVGHSFNQGDIRPFAESIIIALLKNVEKGATPEEIAKNDHLMKCVMRVIITARQALIPSYNNILQHLVAILTEVSKNPSNPRFNHFAFESISALIRCVWSSNTTCRSLYQCTFLDSSLLVMQLRCPTSSSHSSLRSPTFFNKTCKVSPFLFSLSLSTDCKLLQNSRPSSSRSSRNSWSCTRTATCLRHTKGSSVLS